MTRPQDFIGTNRYRLGRGVRFEKEDGIKLSPKSCPICGNEMGVSFDGWVIYSAVLGPYAHGTVRYQCQADLCRYLDSTRFNASNNECIDWVWEISKMIENGLKVERKKVSITRTKKATRRLPR